MSKNPPKKAVTVAFGFNVVIAVIFALVAGTTAVAQTGHIKKSQSDKAASKAADEEAGEYETAAVDPKTGKLRQATREEAAALAAEMKQMVNQSSEGLTRVYHANGMSSVDLEGRFQSIAVAKKNPDGTITQTCLTSAPEVDAFLGIVPKPKADHRAAKATRRSRAKANRRAVRKEQNNEK
jgi:hypothetical protein